MPLSSPQTYIRFSNFRKWYGVDLVIVQELLRHKSIVMTKRYSNPTPEPKRKAVESLVLNNKVGSKTNVINIKKRNDYAPFLNPSRIINAKILSMQELPLWYLMLGVHA